MINAPLEVHTHTCKFSMTGRFARCMAATSNAKQNNNNTGGRVLASAVFGMCLMVSPLLLYFSNVTEYWQCFYIDNVYSFIIISSLPAS